MPKYSPFPAMAIAAREWPDRVIDRAPMWCSVDLRDGNQALPTPMGVARKLSMFELLCGLGFKEIEVGFPASSRIEYDFVRRLIEEDRIPPDVTIQILCQTRRRLIERSVESLQGARRAIFHLYTSTSPVQRKITFGMNREELKAMIVRGILDLKELLPGLPGTRVVLQFSPESFSATETDYALEVCEAVMDAWCAGPDNIVILNLPATVESSTPNVHADQIEYFRKNLPRPEAAVISVHTHNDRGSAVAAAELALLAGAGRVEGTLFGNGERTGNLDIVTMALNMKTQGLESGLDFSDMPKLISAYETLTGMRVHERHPYAGELVFTAFSGSHQDAIKKGMERRAEILGRGIRDSDCPWEVAYLPMDPKDVGRSYEAIIRINSQSGKGGVAYVMKDGHGYELPKAMHPEFGAIVNRKADELGRELAAGEILECFREEYLFRESPISLVSLRETGVSPDAHSSTWEAVIRLRGEKMTVSAEGSGPIEAFIRSIGSLRLTPFRLTAFHEHALGEGADARAVAYVELEARGGFRRWGCGVDANIACAGVRAVASAINRAEE
jgi:2-isopropylmalate synthase